MWNKWRITFTTKRRGWNRYPLMSDSSSSSSFCSLSTIIPPWGQSGNLGYPFLVFTNRAFRVSVQFFIKQQVVSVLINLLEQKEQQPFEQALLPTLVVLLLLNHDHSFFLIYLFLYTYLKDEEVLLLL